MALEKPRDRPAGIPCGRAVRASGVPGKGGVTVRRDRPFDYGRGLCGGPCGDPAAGADPRPDLNIRITPSG